MKLRRSANPRVNQFLSTWVTDNPCIELVIKRSVITRKNTVIKHQSRHGWMPKRNFFKATELKFAKQE